MPIKKARVRTFILLTILFVCMLASARAFAASEDTVRVLLTRVGTTYTTLFLKADCAYRVNGTDIPAGTEMKVKLGGGRVYLYAGGEGIASGSSMTVCRNARGKHGAVFTSPKVSGRYFGDITFLALDDGIASVLTKDVEDYLYGVLPYEMSESFSSEADTEKEKQADVDSQDCSYMDASAGSAAGQSSINVIDTENGWAGVIDGTVRGYIRTKYLLFK